MSGGPVRGDERALEKRAALERKLLEKLAGQKAHDDRRGQIPRRRSAEPAPLSYGQQRLWFLEKFAPHTGVYNIPRAMRVRGPLDVAALRAALNAIVARHEALRTIFTEQGGQPVQQLRPDASVDLLKIDLSSLPEPARDEAFFGLLRDEGRRPFNLASDLLLRAMVVRLGVDDHGLLIVMHHVASDGWSMAIFIRELMELYDAHRAGRSAKLADLPIQYADFSIWQRQWLYGPELTRQLEYWKKQLSGTATLEMPTDRPRPAVMGYAGDRQTRVIPPATHVAIQALGKSAGTTSFMTLVAAFQVLLHRYTGQTDISVGSPIAGRTRAEAEGLIGFFINTLVLRTDLSGDPTFSALLARVKEVALSAFAHQEIPFERLVEELKPERSTSRSPLFQVMFILQSAPQENLELAGLSMERLDVDSDSTKFDLSMSVHESAAGLKVSVNYNTDLFDGATITRLLGHYQTLLESIAAHPELSISKLQILDNAEREQLLVTWNQTGADFPRQCVHDLITEQAARTPSAVALSRADEQVSYAELDRRSNQLARLLQRHGVGPDSPVGIFCERSIETVIGMLAVLKAGGAYVPMDPAYPRDRVAFMVDHSRLSVILTHQALETSLPDHKAHVIRVDADRPLIDAEDPGRIESGATPESLAYVLYTSGSTGKPKGVQIEHRALVNLLQSAKQRPGLSSSDRVLAVTSFSFDIAGLEIWLPLTVGGQTEVASVTDAMDGERLSRKLAEAKITVLQGTPTTFQLLAATGWRAHRGLKVVAGGEAVPRALATRLCEQGATMWNGYGPTETTIYSTFQQLSAAPGPVYIGRPIHNTQTYILDAARSPVPIGVPGELYIGGVGLARGYFGRPDLTAERFIQGPFDSTPGTRLYRTGDLCRYRPDGTLEFLGRLDHQVKLRGYRIELGEIEAVLGAHPAVREVVAVVREDDPGNPRVCAYLALRPSQTVSPAELRDHVRQKLPDYMVPSAFVTLDALPRTPNAKIDRKALPVPEEGAGTATRGFVAPRTAVEEKLAKIWCDVLHLPKVSVTDSFFDLGGHSMLAAQMMAAVESTFEKQVPLAVLFENQTIERLSRFYADDAALPDQWPLVIPVQPHGDKAPLFCVSRFNVSALGYIALARNLGLDQPVYGLQLQHREEDATPYQPFEFQTAAEQYLAAMKEVQPKGPYNLIGMCEGALISFEITRMLRASGEKVAFLGMLDAWPIENTRRYFFTRLDSYRRRGVRHWRKIKSAPPNERAAAAGQLLAELAQGPVKLGRELVDKVRVAAGVSGGTSAPPGGQGREKPPTFDGSYKRYYWPGPDFVPNTVDIVISLFRIRDQPMWRISDPACGWRTRTTAGVDIHTLTSDHFSLLREPHVGTLAQLVAAGLAKSAGDSKPS